MSETPKVSQEIIDPVNENLKQLEALFPAAVKDGQLDIEALKAELGQFEEVGEEKYQLNWPGKQAAKQKAFEKSAGRTLKFVPDESKNPETTENIFIEGDNLEVLQLLRKNYYGAIKMIYIDPPYNTGNDFVYKDNFKMSQAESARAEGNVSEDGERLVKNSKDSGRYHSNWLNMMYPRLKIARELLTEDGVIFISIDDNEVNNLSKLCEVVFGEENFVARLIWEGANKNDAKHVGVAHEYVLVYAKSRFSLPGGWRIAKEGVEPVLKEVERLKKECGDDFKGASKKLAGWFRSMKATPSFGLRRFSKIDERGAYKEDDPTAPGGRRFELKHPQAGQVIPLRSNRGWGFDQETFNSMVEQGRISFVTETSIMVRRYLHETDSVTPPSVFYQPARSASERLGKLFGKKIFDFPKDEVVVAKFIEMAANSSSEGEIFMDFFAGSSTTAHAVMQLNAEDGGNRKSIMVQIPEACDSTSEAFKAGYKTIAEISKERIRRAGEKVKADYADKEGIENLDVGFKVFKTGDTNINWLKEDLQGGDLLENVYKNASNKDKLDFTPTATDLDVVYEIMLRQADVPLSASVEQLDEIGERTYLFADSYLVCLEEEITQELINDLAEIEPLPIKFVLRDSAFGDDIALKDKTIRTLSALIDRNTGDDKQTYTVEFI